MMSPERVTPDGLNAHTPWDALAAPVTPTSAFFTRSNFEVPRIAKERWRLDIDGAQRPLTYDELTALPARSLEVVLECAGNGRSRFLPPAEGTPWGDRALASARFRGASLTDVLRATGAAPRGVEVVFAGADGKPGGMRFERSLPLDVALREDVLVAYEMNDESLAPEHGFPARLVVPSWYGVASVKWLVAARFTAEPFRGHFQAERYIYESKPGAPDAVPVREMRVKSILSQPQGEVRAGERARIRGWAWSGVAPIAGVDVSMDGGESWQAASLDEPRGKYAWRGFWLDWTPERAGVATLASRARDEARNVQPDAPAWNVHGYGNNAVLTREVVVRNA